MLSRPLAPSFVIDTPRAIRLSSDVRKVSRCHGAMPQAAAERSIDGRMSERRGRPDDRRASWMSSSFSSASTMNRAKSTQRAVDVSPVQIKTIES